MNPATHLRQRADSYSHDAFVLQDEPDMGHMVVAYRTIADELRKCADQLDSCGPYMTGQYPTSHDEKTLWDAFDNACRTGTNRFCGRDRPHPTHSWAADGTDPGTLVTVVWPGRILQ